MKTHEPIAPDGNRWTVGVPLLPWEPRLRHHLNPGRVMRSKALRGGRLSRGTARDNAERTAQRISDGFDLSMFMPDLLDDFAVGALAIGAIIVVMIVLGLAFGWVLPWAILAIELVLALLAFAAVGLWRTLSRRPWVVLVTSPTGQVRSYFVVGYRRARRVASLLADRVGSGQPLPDSGPLDPAAQL